MKFKKKNVKWIVLSAIIIAGTVIGISSINVEPSAPKIEYRWVAWVPPHKGFLGR